MNPAETWHKPAGSSWSLHTKGILAKKESCSKARTGDEHLASLFQPLFCKNKRYQSQAKTNLCLGHIAMPISMSVYYSQRVLEWGYWSQRKELQTKAGSGQLTNPGRWSHVDGLWNTCQLPRRRSAFGKGLGSSWLHHPRLGGPKDIKTDLLALLNTSRNCQHKSGLYIVCHNFRRRYFLPS